MSILKCLIVFTYLLWVVVTISTLLNPTIKSLIPLIVVSTSVIVGTLVTKMTKKLIKNKWKCLYCGDVIESKHQHDFSTCKCGKSSCDSKGIKQ